jgi:hypothetical protein
MNRKDLSCLAEAYKEVAVETVPVAPEVNDAGKEPMVNTDYADLKDLGQETQKMALSNLHSLRAHAYEILTVLENGVLIEPWMDEKIAIATDYVITVADSIMYRK